MVRRPKGWMLLLGILALVAAGFGLSPPHWDTDAELGLRGWQFAWSWTVGTVLEPGHPARPTALPGTVEQTRLTLALDSRTDKSADMNLRKTGYLMRVSRTGTVYAYPLLC